MNRQKRKSSQKKKIRKLSKLSQQPSLSYNINNIQDNTQRTIKNNNRFILNKILGVGGLCEVFLATDLLRVTCGDNSPQVAIKRLLPQYAQEFKAKQLLVREFIITRSLNHSGVVRVYDLHDTPYGPVISMELLEGELLSSFKFRLGDEIIPIAKSLFETLQIMHGFHVAHGDIKPGNILLEKNSRLVLFDFNTADVETPAGTPSSSVTRSICADLRIPSYSPLYASPERLQGAAPSIADDMFAACCTLYELAEGAHPFNRKPSLEAMAYNFEDGVLKYLPKKFRTLLINGLSFEPGKRPSAQDFNDALNRKGVFQHVFG
jgi:Serine/threonine protein kinase